MLQPTFIRFKRHLYFGPGPSALRRDTRGVAAVEFGLIGGLFVLLICFWIEIGLGLFMQTALDRAVRKESRLIRTGALTASGASTFAANLCADLQALMTCSNIQVNVASGSSFAALSAAVPTTSSSPIEMPRPSGFRRDARASIAVEFALLAPVMLVMLFGSISAARLARASIKTWNIAQSLGDLVAQQTTLTTAQMTDFCTGGKLTLAPFTGTLTATAASVTTSISGTRAVDWQDTTCGGAALSNALALGAPYTPNAGDSVVVVQATYVYAFPPSYILPSSFTFTRTTYSRPRAGTTVAHA